MVFAPYFPFAAAFFFLDFSSDNQLMFCTFPVDSRLPIPHLPPIMPGSMR